MAKQNQFLKFIKLVDSFKNTNNYKRFIGIEFPSFFQVKLDFNEKDSQQKFDPIEFIEKYNIKTTDGIFKFSKLKEKTDVGEDFEELFVIELIYQSICIYKLSLNKARQEKLLLFLNKFKETNNFQKDLSNSISFAFDLYIGFITMYQNDILTANLIKNICSYLESSPLLTKDCFEAICLLLKSDPIQHFSNNFEVVCHTIDKIISEKAEFFDITKIQNVLGVFTTMFNKLHPLAMKNIAILSNLATNENILQLYAVLPSFLIDKVIQNNDEIEFEDKNFEKPKETKIDFHEMFPPLDFSLIKNTATFEDLFSKENIQLIDLVISFLVKSSQPSLMHFIKSYEKLLQIKNNDKSLLLIVGIFAYILSQMKTVSQIRLMTSALIPTFVFSHDFCVFGKRNKWINLMRNVVFSAISMSDAIQFLVILGDASDEMNLFAEYVLRFYKYWDSSDLTVFSHPYFIIIMLNIDMKLSKLMCSDTCKVILYTFMFDLLQFPVTSALFFSIVPHFYDEFFMHIFDETFEERMFSVLKFYFNKTITHKTTTFCDYIIDNDLVNVWSEINQKTTEKIIKLIIENCFASDIVNESFNNLIPYLVDHLTENPNESMAKDIMKYIAKREDSVSPEEFQMIFKTLEQFEVCEEFRHRIWEIASAQSAILSTDQTHLIRPYILPLLFNIYNTDELIEIFIRLINYSSVNAHLMHEGLIDYILIKHLITQKDVEARSVLIHMKVTNFQNCFNLVTSIMKVESSNSIVSLFVEAFHPRNINKNTFLLSEICNNALSDRDSVKSPIIAIGQVPTQLKTNTFTNSIFQTGFTVSMLVKINIASTIVQRMNVTIFKITDGNNYLKVYLSVGGVSLLIRNNRKKISAVLSFFNQTNDWMHIMISVAATETGIQFWPVIDDIESNCTNVTMQSVFGEKLTVEFGGCEEVEMKESKLRMLPVGIAQFATLFNRPLTDEECKELRNDPMATNLDPCFVSSKKKVFSRTSNLLPLNFIENALQNSFFSKITNVLFSTLNEELEDKEILSLLGILQKLIYFNPVSEKMFPYKKLSRFLTKKKETSYMLFKGLCSFYEQLVVEKVVNGFFQLIIANPFIWMKSKDAIRIFRELKRKFMNSFYETTPEIIHSFIIAYKKCPYALQGLVQDIIMMFVNDFKENNITILFSECVNIAKYKFKFILSVLLKTKKELIKKNPNRTKFINLLHRVFKVDDDDEMIIRSSLLFLKILKEDEEKYFFSLFFSFCTLESTLLERLFRRIIEETKENPEFIPLLFAIAIKISDNNKSLFVSKVLENREIIPENMNFKLWYIFPLILACQVQEKQRNIIVDFLARAIIKFDNLETDLGEIHSFCEYCSVVSYRQARNIEISLLLSIREKLEKRSPYVYKYLAYSLTYHTSNNENNYNIDKNPQESGLLNLSSPLELMKFARTDFSKFNTVFQIILNENEWENKEFAKIIIGDIPTIPKDSIYDVIRSFASGKKFENLNKVIEKKSEVYKQELLETGISINKELDTIVKEAMHIVSLYPVNNFKDLQDNLKNAEISFKEIPQNKELTEVIYKRDEIYTKGNIQNKITQEVIYNDPYSTNIKEKETTHAAGSLSFICKLKQLDYFEECTLYIYPDRYIISSKQGTNILEFRNVEQFLFRSTNSFEVIMDTGESFYLSFVPCEFSSIVQKIREQCIFPNAVIKQFSISYIAFGQTKALKKWYENKISNFNLIILLNHYSGRSFKSKEDYLIFPRIFDTNFKILRKEPPFEAEHRGPIEGSFTEKFLTHDVAFPEAFFFPEMAEDYPKGRFSSAAEFVYKNRIALESNEVSEWLPSWINKHFGSKAKLNSIITFSLKQRESFTSLAHTDEVIFNHERIIFYSAMQNNSVFVTVSGDIYFNCNKKGSINIDESCIFSKGKEFIICYSRKKYLLWVIKLDSITKYNFYYDTNCFLCTENEIFVVSGNDCILRIAKDSLNPSVYYSTNSSIAQIALNEVQRTFLVATEDNVLHIFTSGNKVVNEVSFESRITHITQSQNFGYIYVKTKDKLTALTANGKFISSITIKGNLISCQTVCNYKSFDVVICQTDKRIVCYSAILSEAKEVMKTKDRIISILYDKHNFNINLLLSSGSLVHLPYNFI